MLSRRRFALTSSLAIGSIAWPGSLRAAAGMRSLSSAQRNWLLAVLPAEDKRYDAFAKLLVTSERDWLVDPEHGRALARAAAPPVDYVHFDLPGNLHADALVTFAPTRLLRVLDRWLARHAPA